MTVTSEDDPALTRAQRRLLRRIFNGRQVPLVVNRQSFLTYKDASRYLLTLEPEACDTAYAAIKEQASAPPQA